MKRIAIAFILFCLSSSVILAEPQAANGTISDVIVYHGRALVTRTIELDKARGDVELLVGNLPSNILISKDTRDEVKAIDEQITDIEQQIYKIDRDRDYLGQAYGRVCKMWELDLKGANVSLERAAFSSETMKDFTSYLLEQNEALHNRTVEIELERKNLEKQMQKLKKERARLSAQHQHSIRQALVYLNIPKSSRSESVQLSYLVNGADWSPQYNLKADPDNKQVKIEYNAVVHQASGEDWNNATLALSTAVPALVAGAPTLEPMKIDLTMPRARRASAPKQPQQTEQMQMMMDMELGFTDQSKRYNELAQSRYSNIKKGIKAQQELNTIAIDNQMIEFKADKQMLKEMNRQAVAIRRTEGVSVLYRLDGKLTLPSRSDQQLVTIAAFNSKANFVFTAAPLLTDYVYLQADITNNSDTILLPGTADMFRGGEFVGKGDMKLVTIGQTFTAGFGVDSQIQVAREFKDKKIETLWGNRVDENHYRIAVQNYYDKSVALRLMDRLPWTESGQLGIELISNSHELSENPEYVRTQKNKGILRWDIQLDPNTTGESATIVNYAFTLKYDSDMAIRTIR
ncbi:MAG: mucoidy inhibitor MuiA family protein [Planctomycetota bacterium]|jgi:hypothetical protein